MPAIRIFLLLLLAYFLSYFFRSANAVISKDLQTDLGLSSAQLGLMTSLFYLSFALVNLPLGGLLDRYGPRFVHPALMLLGAGGSLIYAGAQNFWTLALGRLLLGIGFAAALMGALKAFSLWFPRQRYATVSGLFVGLGGSGAIAAATPLVLLKNALGWREVFLWGALLIVLVALIIAIGVRNAPAGVPWPKAQEGGAIWAVWRDLRIWRIGLLNLILGGGFLAWQTLWGGAYLFGRGFSDGEVGRVLLVFSLAATSGFLSSGSLADRLGLGRTLFAAGAVFLGALSSLVLWPHSPLVLVYAAYATMGFSGGFTILALAQGRLIFPSALTGRVITGINFMGFIGVFLLQWGLGLAVGLAGYPLALTLWMGLIVLVLGFYWPMVKNR
jgi:predicted MFS family arabinose efflux permease